MTLTGSKQGSLQTLVNAGGIAANTTLSFSGSSNPAFGITAPAALSGTLASGTFTIANSGTATFAGTEKVAVYWTVAGVNYYRYDCTISSGTAQNTFTISSGTGTALPSGGQSVLVATNQDITDGVSITGNNIQQLIATSTQPGLVEWLNVTPTQDRLSAITAAGGYDTWPTAAGQLAPPTNWTSMDVVVTLRCWNFSTSSAVMQVGALLT